MSRPAARGEQKEAGVPLDTFAQFTGRWRTHITRWSPDGAVAGQATGEWEFRPALDGRAVLDVWRVPGRATATSETEREVGLCVRIWDSRLQLWRFTFHSTATGAVIHMYGHRIGAEIVLERADGDRLERWVFFDIDDTSFSWRSEISTRGGPWLTTQTVAAHREPDHEDLGLAAVLLADRPHPSIAAPAEAFDQFRGAWDGTFTHLDRAEEVIERYSGDIVFGWVLDGRAVQDVWTGYPSRPGEERSVGTTLRFFDPATAQWQVVWIAPQAAVIRHLTGGPTADGRIVLTGQTPDGADLRWSFEDITSHSFTWRGERRDPGDSAWWTTAAYQLIRRNGGTSEHRRSGARP